MLTKIKFAPGIDKQDTAVGAEGRWVDSDNVRFRYGLPESILSESITLTGWRIIQESALCANRHMNKVMKGETTLKI